MLALSAALIFPAQTGAAAAAPSDADHLALADLTTRPVGIDAPGDVIPFQLKMDYRLGSTANAFLLVFVFENEARTTTNQSAANAPVQSGSGRVTLDIDYPVHDGVRTLSFMVAMFENERKMLTWVSTRPFDLAPWPGRVAFDKAMAARSASDYASADSYLSTAIASSPQNGTYYYWRGDTRVYLTRYADAVEDFDQASALMPEDRATRVGRGVALLWQGNPEAALGDLTFAIDHTSTPDRLSAYAFRVRGTAHAALRQPGPAIDDYRTYLQLMPDAVDRGEVEGWLAELDGKAA